MDTNVDTALTENLRERAAKVMPGGVNSNVRLDAPNLFFAKAQGGWLYDTDGKDYVDYLLGQGPAFLGHAHPKILKFVSKACQAGMVFGAQHPLEVEAAERVIEALKWPEMVRLGSTGTESVQAAVRLARAVTGRKRIIRFEGQYHGWLDNVLIKFEPGPAAVASAGQLPESLAATTVLPWNDLSVVRQALEREGDSVAAIITEPMMLNQGAIEPREGYLEGLRQLCDEFGCVLIFDEVITGFRLARGGAAQHYDVKPDLAVYGKALAGGFPVSAVAGRADYMERFGTGEVNHSGTFNACVMAAAAVVAAMDVIKTEVSHEQITHTGKKLMSGLAAAAAKREIPLRLQGPGVAFHASMQSKDPDERVEVVHDLRDMLKLDNQGYRTFTGLLAEAGVWVARRGIWYLSMAHGEAEVEQTLARVGKAMDDFVSLTAATGRD